MEVQPEAAQWVSTNICVCCWHAHHTVSRQAHAGADLVKAGGSCACAGAPRALAPLHQLTPICHLLHHFLLHEEEVHALHLALFGLLAGVPGANAQQCESFVTSVEAEVVDEGQAKLAA